jgi:hypothetical protein
MPIVSLAQAMSIVTDRVNAGKAPPPTSDAKTGRLAPGAVNNEKDLGVDLPKEEPSFFGSFFNPKSKKRPALTNGRPDSPVSVPY